MSTVIVETFFSLRYLAHAFRSLQPEHAWDKIRVTFTVLAPSRPSIMMFVAVNMMTGQPAQPVIILTATDITIEGLEGARTVNVTRILSQACPGCNDLNACAKYLEDKGVSTITVDIETLTQYGNAKRFSNIRLS